MKSESKSKGYLVEVASREELDEQGRLVVEIGVQRLVLVDLDGEIRCVPERCPHAGGSLSGGHIKDGQIACPRHGWRFDLESGRCLSNPRYEIEVFSVVVEEGQIKVWIDE